MPKHFAPGRSTLADGVSTAFRHGVACGDPLHDVVEDAATADASREFVTLEDSTA